MEKRKHNGTIGLVRFLGNGVLLFGLIFLAGAPFAWAHQHWLDLDSYSPGKGEGVGIYICSGHDFPASAFSLGDRVMGETSILGPDGEKEYTTVKGKKKREGKYTFTQPGIYLVDFNLKRPRMEEPLFFGRAIVHVEGPEGGATDYNNKNKIKDNHNDLSKKRLYKKGRGLEIIPGKLLTNLKKNEGLTFLLFYDGLRVEGKGEISLAGKTHHFLTFGGETGAEFKVKRGGKYLVSASYKGKECALTFCIKEFK